MAIVTDFNELDLNGSYTYADYLKWQFKERLELFRGKIFKMSPAPSRYHQEIGGNLHGIMWNFLAKHLVIFMLPLLM